MLASVGRHSGWAGTLARALVRLPYTQRDVYALLRDRPVPKRP